MQLRHGRKVDVLVRFHTGYELDDADFHDVRVLCERFGIAMPNEYPRFTGSQSRA
jgi:lincosamide nucleotidyltransferase A/C/D/E